MSGKPKKGQKKPSNQSANQTAAEQAELSETEESVSFRDGNEAINMAAGLQDFEVILTRRLKEQSESIHDMMLKYFKLYKDDIDEIKRSQAFVDAKFEKAKKATEDLTLLNLVKHTSTTAKVRKIDLSYDDSHLRLRTSFSDFASKT